MVIAEHKPCLFQNGSHAIDYNLPFKGFRLNRKIILKLLFWNMKSARDLNLRIIFPKIFILKLF